MLIRFIFRVNHIFTAIQHVAVAQNWHIPGSNATEKNTTDLKAIPPRRGTDSLVDLALVGHVKQVPAEGNQKDQGNKHPCGKRAHDKYQN